MTRHLRADNSAPVIPATTKRAVDDWINRGCRVIVEGEGHYRPRLGQRGADLRWNRSAEGAGEGSAGGKEVMGERKKDMKAEIERLRDGILTVNQLISGGFPNTAAEHVAYLAATISRDRTEQDRNVNIERRGERQKCNGAKSTG